MYIIGTKNDMIGSLGVSNDDNDNFAHNSPKLIDGAKPMQMADGGKVCTKWSPLRMNKESYSIYPISCILYN